MPYGSGILIRTALTRANTWQRYLLGAAMVVGGVALTVLGHVAGALLALAGVLLVVRMGRARVRATTGQQRASAPSTGSEQVTGTGGDHP